MNNSLEKIKSKIANLLKTKSFFFIWSSIVFIIGIIFHSYVGELSTLFAQKTFQSKKLTYEVLSITRHNKNELFELSEVEGFNSFNLNLDDPIIKDYYVIKVMLKNIGASIDHPLNFEFSSGSKCCRHKILDMRHKILYPRNKSMKINNSILNDLVWALDENYSPIFLKWSYDDHKEISGFNIYRSLIKDAGYGQINDRLVTNPSLRIQSNSFKEIYPNYYGVTVVGTNGLESDINMTYKMTDFTAFHPLFKNLIYVEPNFSSTEKADGSPHAPFRSLGEAISKAEISSTYFVKSYREKLSNVQNFSDEVKVIYLDDLKFLNGIAEVSLLSGLDENAEVLFYFLVKTLPDEEFDISLRLEGSPNVIMSKVDSNDNINKQNVKNIMSSKDFYRVSLTPYQARVLQGNGSQFIVWDKPKNNAYKSVRIFRSARRSTDDLSNIGKELFEGRGNDGESLECKLSSREPIGTMKSSQRKIENLTPPPRLKKNITISAPLPPMIISVTAKLIISFPEAYYFEDKTVSPNKAYTYTLYAYDDKDNYSYPVTVNSTFGANQFHICNQSSP